MRRLLSTTTALALAMTPMAPLPLPAQTLAEDGSVIGEDGTVLCTPTADAPCDLKAIKKELKRAENKAKKAEEAAAAEAAAQAEAEAKAAEEAAAAEQKAAEEAAAAQAAADAAAAEAAAAEAAAAEQKAAEDAAAAEAKAAEEAAAQAAAEAEQKAAEEAAAAEQKAADEAAAAEAAAQAEADQKAAEEAAAAEAAAAEAAAQAAADQKATEEAAGQAAQTDSTSQPAPGMMPDQTLGEGQPAVAEGPSTSLNDQPNVEAPVPGQEPAGDGTTTTEVTSVPGQTAEDPVVPVAEQTINPDAVTTPPTEEEVQALTDLLAQPPAADSEAGQAAAAAAEAAAEAASGTTTAQAPAPTVTETVLTEEDTRSSTEDFATTASGKKKKKDKDDGLSDFEKAGLVALGALAVGVLLSNRDQVVSNTGDRVVVQRSDGNYAVYKDDDALLRQPGSAVKTETFKDGSTRTTVTRDDGTSVVTIRDATGRVLKRTAYDTKGREIVLIDDLVKEIPVVVSTLPKPTAPVISTQGGDPELAAALAAIQARDIGRTFSLRQVRDIKEVRALAATVDVDNITFDTGSAAITTAQAENLADLGSFLKKMLAKNPGEIFLIEGHTDAVGSAASNLALSDRRAESVALALTEYFGVPPENLVVQGYGESDLRVPTDGDERRNRRVAVRVITPLLTVASN